MESERQVALLEPRTEPDPAPFRWSDCDRERWAAPRASTPPSCGGDPRLRSLLECLSRRGAHGYAHAVGSFYEHLVGTWQILTAWHQPPTLCRAGLFHSVYATDFFSQPLFAGEERAEVASHIGAEAESLVFLFCTIDRLRLARDLGGLDAIPEAGVAIHNHRTGDVAEISSATVSALFALEMANMAEQQAGPAREPAHWSPLCSRMGRALAPHAHVVPPVYDCCRQVVSDAAEDAALDAYALALEASDPEERRSAAACAVESNPFVGEPRLVLASALAEQGRVDDAREQADRGLAALLAWGTAWDKRFSWVEWLSHARAIRAANGGGRA